MICCFEGSALLLEQNIRFHCPVFCILSFNKTVSKAFTRHIWLYDKGNYDGLSDALSNANMAKIVRQTDPPWLTSKIKK